MLDIDSLLANAKAATGTTWELGEDSAHGLIKVLSHDKGAGRWITVATCNRLLPKVKQDAAFIVAAQPSVIIELIARLKKAEGV